MRTSRLCTVLALGALLVACGGNDTKEVDCDKDLKYQNRVTGKHVVAPEGLDQLDEFRAMPIPKADASAPSPAPGTCYDMPPMIRTGS